MIWGRRIFVKRKKESQRKGQERERERDKRIERDGEGRKNTVSAVGLGLNILPKRKLAIYLGYGDIKIVSIALWNHPDFRIFPLALKKQMVCIYFEITPINFSQPRCITFWFVRQQLWAQEMHTYKNVLVCSSVQLSIKGSSPKWLKLDLSVASMCCL